MKELKIGIVGLNDGNGHPFSYAAIFNGYDPAALERDCPFQLIREYLPRDHGNKAFLLGAKVTHVWTQSREISEAVARVSRIPVVVDQMEDMIGEVDAVILARDDPWNHLEMAKPFLAAGLPLFIDKLLAHSPEDCREILEMAGSDYPLMAGSPARYSRDVQSARSILASRRVLSIHGMSRVSWLRYGHHVFEPIAALFGLDIDWVRSLSAKPDHDIIQIQYTNGPSVILEFITNVHLPVEFVCYSPEAEPLRVPFSDFFHSFRVMLGSFVELVRDGASPYPREEMVRIAQVILAGDISKKRGGVVVEPYTFIPS